MIIFDLACNRGHRFEGWFSSTDDYAQQTERELVRCPVCDNSEIAKLPSAKVRVGKAAEPAPVAASPAKPTPTTASVPTEVPSPAEVIAQLRALVKAAEDVGTRFADEARKIHYEETPARSIRGQTSPDEAEALREEGIEFASVPAFLVEESH